MTYPTILPKLTLDFANSRQLDPRITFSRSSSATYLHPDTGLITTAPSDVARFEEQGLLIEEARTNLLTYSEEFDNAVWGQNDCTVTPDVAAAPDGTSTADKLVAANTNAAHYLVSSASVTATSHTVSVYGKSAEKEWLTLNVYNGSTYLKFSFNVSAGEIGIVPAGGSSAIQPLANGWYKCTATYTSAVAGNNSIHIHVYDDASTEIWQGNGVDGLYIWGAQVEEGSFPTSYIPTAGATATRAADITLMTGTNLSSWFNPNSGTIFTIASCFAPTYSAANRFVWYFTNPGLKQHNARANGFQFYDSGYGSGNQYVVPYVTNIPNKAVYSFETNNTTSAINGSLASLSTSWSPTDHTLLSIGSNNGTNLFLNGHISRFTYYPVRLPDEQLQALTA